MHNQPHRRYNPLNGEWVLVSPQRDKRPWQGQQETPNTDKLPRHDSTCYLCPGNSRNNGAVNPNYTSTYVFTNDFPALLPNPTSPQSTDDSPFFQAQPVNGTCRVICFSPRHDLTLANMNLDAIERVIHCWQTQIKELKQEYTWIQIFENKGAIVGCSNPHPHGQIWASGHLPNEAVKECHHQQAYFKQHQRPLLLDYVEREYAQQQRIVCDNDDWVVVVPFWATWPFETLLLPRFHCSCLTEITAVQRTRLAAIIQHLNQTYNALFKTEFPYTMGWHNAPQDQQPHPEWQCHAHFYPPLLRSATIKKFMVGYEMLAESQRDITPEKATQQLKEAAHVLASHF